MGAPLRDFRKASFCLVGGPQAPAKGIATLLEFIVGIGGGEKDYLVLWVWQAQAVPSAWLAGLCPLAWGTD